MWLGTWASFSSFIGIPMVLVILYGQPLTALERKLVSLGSSRMRLGLLNNERYVVCRCGMIFRASCKFGASDAGQR